MIVTWYGEGDIGPEVSRQGRQGRQGRQDAKDAKTTFALHFLGVLGVLARNLRDLSQGPGLVATVNADPICCPLDLAADRLAARIGSWTSPALLEGGSEFGQAGRWSFLTARPRLIFQATGSNWTLDRRDRSSAGSGDVLGALGHLLRRYGLADPAEAPDPSLPPFQGGLIGFLGYDLAPRLERLPRQARRDSRLPDIRFALYDTVVAMDHLTGSVDLWAFDLLGEGPSAVERRARAWRWALARPGPVVPASSWFSEPESNFRRRQYLEAVERALEYIAAGDIFQVNLTQKFETRGRPEPLDLYLRLRRRSPAPFSAFLRWDDLAVVSSSPEWFYQTIGRRIVTRPIKGTRPRDLDPIADARLAAELQSSPKDRAELTMIVDLERNDLGRVCEYGTVLVTEPLTIESYAQVHHLVATVEGRLRPDVGPAEVVRAVFPGGSITGAPKIRAMQIIDELEPTRRSLYTGAIGYFSRGGTSAFNIAIRTMLVEGDRVTYQVGGGIVADSVPELEFEETLHKARGMREVLEGLL